MAVSKKHSLVLDDNKKVSLCGVVRVNSIFDREIEVETETNRVTIKGAGLRPSVLNVEEGTLTVEGENVYSVVYSAKGKKINFKGLFK